MIISLIVVVDEDNGIGKNNGLLCHLPADLRYFRLLTTGHHIIMGRKTFESVGKPLPNRTNIIVSSTLTNVDGCVIVKNLDEAIRYAKEKNENELFITGGGIIFSEAMSLAQRVYLTKIHHRFDADTFFPAMKAEEWKQVKEEQHNADEKNKFDYTFYVYERV